MGRLSTFLREPESLVIHWALQPTNWKKIFQQWEPRKLTHFIGRFPSKYKEISGHLLLFTSDFQIYFFFGELASVTHFVQNYSSLSLLAAKGLILSLRMFSLSKHTGRKSVCTVPHFTSCICFWDSFPPQFPKKHWLIITHTHTVIWKKLI